MGDSCTPRQYGGHEAVAGRSSENTANTLNTRSALWLLGLVRIPFMRTTFLGGISLGEEQLGGLRVLRV